MPFVEQGNLYNQLGASNLSRDLTREPEKKPEST